MENSCLARTGIITECIKGLILLMTKVKTEKGLVGAFGGCSLHFQHVPDFPASVRMRMALTKYKFVLYIEIFS